MNYFLIQEIGQWQIYFFSQPHPDGGMQGHADIHDGSDLHCRVSLSTKFFDEDALKTALNIKCMAWLKEWDARRLSSQEPGLLTGFPETGPTWPRDR